MAPGERVPKLGDWGFCVYGDAPAGIGGGMPWFYWFPTEAEMVSFLKEHSAFIHPTMGGISTRDMQHKVTVLFEHDLPAGSLDDDFRERLNAVLRHSSQFEWIDSYATLMSGDQDFARKVRASRVHASSPPFSG